MLTKPQQNFYWRLWRDCQEANYWRVEKGRLHIQPERLTAQGREVYAHAQERARQAHRAVTADDLRHGCHIAAVGHDCSLKDLTNQHFDRLIQIMKLVIDGEDLDAAERLVNPEIGQRERLRGGIARMAPDEFVRHISGDRFGTRLWEDLEVEQLQELRRILAHTRYGRGGAPVEEPAPAPDAEIEQPF